MLVSYKWLQEYFDEKLPEPSELAEILTISAFEIEGVNEVGDDYTIDVDVLPNRAHDCLCHYGIAKEISVLTGLLIKEIYAEVATADFETGSNVSVEDKRCFRFTMAEVQNPVVGPSPDELKMKLEVLGQKSINTIVDITNIVMLEIGQPMHAFDKGLVKGLNLIVRATTDGEKITTLDNKEVVFKEGDLAVADREKALSIAPIKGGKASGVTERTKSILLEAANWNSTFARKISKRTGISTESGKRFEHGVSSELAKKGMVRAIELIKKYASDENTKFSNIVDVYPRPPKHPYFVGVSINEINKKLGVELSSEKVEEIFGKLNFNFEKVNPKNRFIETLNSLVGKPYVFGASVLYDAPEGFDCSSLVAYASATSGIGLPRMAVDQFVWADEIAEGELQAGDLVFSNQHSVNADNQNKFADSPDIQEMIRPEHETTKEFLPGTKIDNPLDHVGVYLGDGKIIHCTSSKDKGVVIETLGDSEEFKDIVGYRRIFENVSEVEGENKSEDVRFVVTVPDERIDIRIKEDLIEEVGRIYGYKNLPEPEITSISRVPEVNKTVAYNNLIRKVLTENGFSEIITSSFRTSGEIKVKKSFADDRQYLRKDLSEGMNKTLEVNVYNADLLGLTTVKTFEIGKKFTEEGETLMLCIGIANNKTKKPKPSEILRETVEILEKYLGQSFEISIVETDSVIEINLDKLYDLLKTPEQYVSFDEIGDVKYKIPSAYPFVLRDISVWVPGSTGQQEKIQKMIAEKAGDLLVRDTLVDVYEKADEAKTSYSFRLVFQSEEKTLTDVEVNKVMEDVTVAMNKESGWEVR